MVSLVYISHVLIIQLLIFKHENSVSQKLKPNLIVDEEITIFRNTMKLNGIILHERKQFSRHYTSVIHMSLYKVVLLLIERSSYCIYYFIKKR